jgi:hypothetical protein
MNDLLSIFITWQFLVLCVGIAAVTFVFRTTIEYFILNNPRMPGNSHSRFWRDFILVIFPIFVGVLFAFVAKSFPYPQAIYEPYARILFTASAGLLSPTAYRVIKALLWRNAGGEQPQQPPYNPFFPQNPNFPSNPMFPSNPNFPQNHIFPQNPIIPGMDPMSNDVGSEDPSDPKI